MEKGTLERKKERENEKEVTHSGESFGHTNQNHFGMRNQIVIKINNEKKKKQKFKTKKGKRNINLKKKREKKERSLKCIVIRYQNNNSRLIVHERQINNAEP